MITEHRGNLLHDDAGALVNPVNTVGVMGKGLALQFKRAFPEVFAAYVAACHTGQIRAGKVLPVRLPRHRYVINFPTKRHWRQLSRLEDIRNGLGDLAHVLTELGIREVAVPPLGCGHGGLPWPQVRPLIEDRLGGLDIDVRLYVPDNAASPRVLPIRTGTATAPLSTD